MDMGLLKILPHLEILKKKLSILTETLVEMCSGSGAYPRYYVHLGSSATDSDFHTFLPELLL